MRRRQSHQSASERRLRSAAVHEGSCGRCVVLSDGYLHRSGRLRRQSGDEHGERNKRDRVDPNLSNNVSNFTTTVGVGADLALSVTATSTVPLGGRIMYTFTLTNNGPSVANDVSLDTTLAAGLVFAGNSGDCTGAFPCAFGTLQPGDIKTVNTTACVPGNYSGNLLIKTTGTASTSSSDPNTDNNTASAYTSLAYDVLFGDGFETCP